MSIPKAYINPAVLSWARESIGLEIEDVVASIKQKRVTSETILQWESGDELPQYTQLEKLADIYKRPIALFFFPEPPEEDPVKKDFRSLPESVAAQIPPKIRYLVRKAKVRQIELSELHDGLEQESKITELSDQLRGQNPAVMASAVREQLDVSVAEQKKWSSVDDALKKWRAKVGNLGVWVFKESFGSDDYCGFCIYDRVFPIVYLNNNMSKGRQIFTLFHEVGHILLGTAGIDFRMVPDSMQEYPREEAFCNAFAGSFLVPDLQLIGNLDEDAIQGYADQYKVSKEVILRRYKDQGIIDWQGYNEQIKIWSQYKGKKAKGGGGSYYANQRSYLGDKYLNLAFSQYYKHRISDIQLADYLGVSLQSLPELEGAMLKSEGGAE